MHFILLPATQYSSRAGQIKIRQPKPQNQETRVRNLAKKQYFLGPFPFCPAISGLEIRYQDPRSTGLFCVIKSDPRETLIQFFLPFLSPIVPAPDFSACPFSTPFPDYDINDLWLIYPITLVHSWHNAFSSPPKPDHPFGAALLDRLAHKVVPGPNIPGVYGLSQFYRTINNINEESGPGFYNYPNDDAAYRHMAVPGTVREIKK
ncbi:hypothetical protein CEXT_239961 [Caerostris extrusa]|uniref:Uncharacterized protein n=1 Tax=Caerostris extrusa TaxID=172846 RepID=A0AAV4XDK9_CAEEX|nr:hypothetical protein CEXT_239961 [Caerostris extrusa]